KNDDDLVGVKVVGKEDDIVIASKNGLLIRTDIGKMRSMGRVAGGVIGMRLDKEDVIIGMDIVRSKSSLFVLTTCGFGKRIDYKRFATKGRGGKGMIYLKVTQKTGHSVGIKSVFPSDEIIITSLTGKTIRLQAKDISMQGRTAIGVKLIDIEEGNEVSDFAVISEDD
ncbi:MAG: DNA gyrase C-terminal beta-propeller domain-containing protein, partial [Spirochaetota bacterium]|nr:DNA gyrase C-terminal beta-propeller domain-containing protein [Spirochaetota bacterium]